MLFSALIFGFLGSFHCVGMCGPIAFLLPVDRNNKLKKLSQIFIYHFGRILAYSIIGFTFGLVGKSLSLFGMQQQLSILIGTLMIIAILIPSHKFQKLNLSKPVFKTISRIKTSLGKELRKKTPDTFLTVGFLNGFLPCGLVYMAVLGAIAGGSALEGGFYMSLFGIGTIPLMTAVLWLGNFISGKARQHIRRAIPVFVILMGLLFIIRGLGLGIPYISPEINNVKISASYFCY
ncbi:sulfite exporter TauE/SafE family protein [Zunongwangia sp. H14]|uniref:sulfite exporter TauE/SafE family protein n=1 Tax=Zunongwangia sp. H14 TaxID=3240792 RepID=UPI0035693B63